MRRLAPALAAALVAAVGTAVFASAQGPDAARPAAPPATGVVSYPANFAYPIEVGGERVYTPSEATTTTEVATSTTTTVAPTTTVPASTSTSTTSAPTTVAATTTTTAPATSTTSPASTGCGSSGAVFCEDFSDPNAFTARFDHGWSGALHAGPDDKNGWPMDHDLSCGNPNTTSHTVNIGPGALGETSPNSAAQAFMPCLPGGNPASGHLMTSANTEGYIIAWFSPKPTFTNVRKVCFDNNLTYIGNGEWFQLVFLTPAEAAHKPVWDGVTMDVLDLGYTSPDFPNRNQDGPTTPQGTAANGVKFSVTGNSTADSQFGIRPWVNGGFPGGAEPIKAGPGTADKAPRYQICTTDNGNGTLTITNGSPDGTVHTTTAVGAIPDGPIRVVLEHDEYNPDKHHSNDGPIGTNTGEGYTYHWDNVLVYTG